MAQKERPQNANTSLIGAQFDFTNGLTGTVQDTKMIRVSLPKSMPVAPDEYAKTTINSMLSHGGNMLKMAQGGEDLKTAESEMYAIHVTLYKVERNESDASKTKIIKPTPRIVHPDEV